MLGRLQNGLRLGISKQLLLPRWASVTTNPPVVSLPENEFSKAEDEALQKVITERTKDDPIPEMKNPFEKEKVKCILCSMNITPDYKNLRLLSQFVSSYTGRVYGRHITGLCKAKQSEVEREIMKARGIGMMPYLMKNVKFLKDPALYDPEKPLRPHRF